MVRAFVFSLLTAVLLTPSSALADPLLSGYGGPGGGEQVVLGSTLLGGAGGGGGSGSSGGGSGGGADSLRATPAAAVPTATAQRSTTSGGATKRPTRSRRSDLAGTRRRSSATAPTRAQRKPAPVATGAPPVRPYPSRAADAGGLPLSGGEVLLALLALGTLILVAVGVRLLSDNVHDESATAQATAR